MNKLLASTLVIVSLTAGASSQNDALKVSEISQIQLTLKQSIVRPANGSALFMVDGQPGFGSDLKITADSKLCSFYLTDQADLTAPVTVVFEHDPTDQYHAMKPTGTSRDFQRLLCSATPLKDIQEIETLVAKSRSTDSFDNMTVGEIKKAFGEYFEVQTR